MRAITLWQPWASLLVTGVKEYETRSWRPVQTGWYAIHAAKTKRGQQDYGFDDRRIFALLGHCGIDGWSNLPLGGIVGVVHFDRFEATVPLFADMTDRELRLGDWHQGRFAWHVANRAVFCAPLPCKGHQGIWHFEWDRF